MKHNLYSSLKKNGAVVRMLSEVCFRFYSSSRRTIFLINVIIQAHRNGNYLYSTTLKTFTPKLNVNTTKCKILSKKNLLVSSKKALEMENHLVKVHMT